MTITVSHRRQNLIGAGRKGSKRNVTTKAIRPHLGSKNDEVRIARRNLLVLIAEQALEALRVGLEVRENEYFKAVLENARVNGVISDAGVAELGCASRSNASRWMHSGTFPPIPTQERILIGISKIAQHKIRNLQAGKPEDDGLDIRELSQTRNLHDEVER